MRLLSIVAAALAVSAEAPPPDLQQFDQALNGSKFTKAATLTDKLIRERRAPNGAARPDPLLNSLLGRLYLSFAGGANVAVIYLDRAPIADLPQAIRSETALDHGKALALVGRRTDALRAYREAAAAASNDIDQRRAAIGISRQLLPEDPAAARSAASSIANGPPTAERWAARYLLAASSSLLRDSDAAARLANGAWEDAPNSQLQDLAPLHVETLRAGLAAAAGDLKSELGMLEASNGLTLSADSGLNSQLPVCGDSGIRPSDYVIFGFVAGPYTTRELIPIAASRPEIVGAFYDSLATTMPIKEGNGLKPIGTVFTVACRSIVSQTYVARPPSADPLLEWFVDHGIYPASAWNEADDTHLNAVAEVVDSLAAKFGKDSPLLIAPRWQLMTMLETRSRQGDEVPTGQIDELSTQIASGLRSAGAPEWLARSLELRTQGEELEAEAKDDPARLMAGFQDLMRDELLRAPFSYSRAFLMGMLGNFRDEWPAPGAELVLDLNANSAGLSGRERQAWLLTVAQAQRTLRKDAEAKRTVASAKLGNDLCVMTDSEPHLLEQHFSSDDYPQDLIAGEQEGAVLYEFDLTTSGAVGNPRVVYSLPSGLFDEPSAKGLAKIRYTSPTKSGRAWQCRGIFQPIVWRLPSEQDFWVPSLTPTSPQPTT